MGVRHAASDVTRRRHVVFAVAVVAATWVSVSVAQRMGYPPEEFSARRQQLAAALKTGTLVMFAASAPAPGQRFRQDNDFYYLTGNESLNSVLVMDAATGNAHLFLPRLTAAEIRYEGSNWLEEPDAARARGFTSIQPLGELRDFLQQRRAEAGRAPVWARLSERDSVNHGRVDTTIQIARRRTNPLTQHPTEDALRVESLKAQFPGSAVEDVTPHLDRSRLIKTPREIEILRQTGRISAEAMVRAIQVSGPGRFEYELEAEATQWFLRHGMQGPAYPAIVASGPMGNQWHYEENGRRMNDGELVVMDYGGSLDYLTVDITRTWPVSGRFSDVQLRAYRTVLEAQQAIIAAIRPGVSRDVVRKIAEDIFRRDGFDSRYAYVGHYVGLSVHDVGDWSLAFQAGMVMAIEPILDIPAQQLHVRIEDTILVTPDGAENLTNAVPKDVDEVLRLLQR